MTISRKGLLWLVAICVASAVSVGNAKAVSSEEIGLRKAPLQNENVKLMKSIDYPAEAAGTSKNIDRSFENAPPMIPHDVDGMMDMTKDENMCLACHDVSVAKDLNATAVPASHMTDLRSNKKLKKVADSRFNCSQCHVPMSNAKPLVGNTFETVFRNPNSKKSSNLLDVLNDGVK